MSWDFAYEPVPTSAGEDEAASDVVVALSRPVGVDRVAAAFGELAPVTEADLVLERAPLFWSRIRLAAPVPRANLLAALRRAGLPARYVASAVRPDIATYPLDFEGAAVCRPNREWRARRSSRGAEPETSGRWFLGEREGGIAVDRVRFGSGAGRRLAVIDNDAMEAERLDLDAEILIDLEQPPRSQAHGALMVAWAVGAASVRGGVPFRGVAPSASPRLYCIPKPEVDVVTLPVAIVRAVDDGADVVVTAAYVEGTTSPMLDDALELASRLGRGGRGTPIVLPTGREASSPMGSVHSSWSLGLGEPAGDPRVFCVSPSHRGGGWFVWSDKHGKVRPFANRGPTVRFMAPGDDIAYPFAAPERLYHAESSGASAIAAGALLLVLEANPQLHVDELAQILSRTAVETHGEHPADRGPLADPADVLPPGRDRDGHNAKHGYGRIHARRACTAARDPLAWALVEMGEADAATLLLDAVGAGEVRLPYSPALGRWAVRALMADPEASHALRAVLRHLRLVAGHPERQTAHAPGALLRHIALLARRLERAKVSRGRAARDELPMAVAIASELTAAPIEVRRAVEGALCAAAGHVMARFAARYPTGDDRASHRSPQPAKPLQLR